MDDTQVVGAEQRRRTLDISAVTEADVMTQWPPTDLVAMTEEPDEVKQPNLWLNNVSKEDGSDDGFEQAIGFDDVGRFMRLSRDSLISLLPEGACGELSRDITVIPSRTRPVGLMLRKVTIELMAQLSELRDATDAKGNFRIDKAGFLLDGHRGTGKSQVLNMLAMWARMNGWLVVLEPAPGRYSSEIADIKRSNNGIYIQNEFSQQFLEVLSVTNREMLEEIPVDMSAYGTRAIDGEPVGETQRLYEPLIEKAVDHEVIEKNLTEAQRLERIADYKDQIRMPSMVEQLPDPQNVWEIVDYGLQNDAYAAQAVAELMLQLQRQTTHPVMVIVDEWNECFPVSQYVSIRYDNTRFHGYIPAYHLTMPRALHRWDGHLFKRGVKICATSWRRFKRRDYRPDLLGVKDYEIKTVRNFSQFEFANFVTYYRLMNVLHKFPRQDLEYFYMLTQGNGFQARRLLTTLY